MILDRRVELFGKPDAWANFRHFRKLGFGGRQITIRGKRLPTPISTAMSTSGSVGASLMETYGLTLVEAMACEPSVVVFRVGGTPEAAPVG
jgi:hypothetical protein